jgi:hypothetical protein
MKRFTVRLAMAAMVLSLWIGQTGTGAARADLVYIVAHDATMHFGSGDVFGRLDVGTGAFDQISTLTTPGHTITGMGFGTDGQIYGFGFGFVNGTPSTDLYRIDPATGSATDLGRSASIQLGRQAVRAECFSGSTASPINFSPTHPLLRLRP